jgi:uncharacterized protein YcbK (DUF882 family)
MIVETYSLRKDGRVKLSPNFSVREFACKDGSDEILIAPELVRLLQAVRDYLGVPISITSGYRTVSHNRKVGGASNSFHTRGMAADIWAPLNTPRQVYEAINSGRVPGVRPDWIGLGLYASFVHIDCRGHRARFAGKGIKLPV